MDKHNNNIDPETSKTLKTVFTWIGIIICLNAFWPLGLYLIYRQLSKPSVKNSKIYNTIKDGWDNAKEEFRDNTASQKAKAAEKKETQKLPKANGSVLLLILSIILFVIGLGNISDAINLSSLTQGIFGIFNVIGGFAALGARAFINRKARRLTKYITVMGLDDAKSVDELSDITGFSKKLVRKDLNYLAERGYFGSTAYFDIGLDSIVISPEAAENERKIRYAAETASRSTADTASDKYQAILVNMQNLKDSIKDPKISAKADHLIETTRKIFKIVEDAPQKEPQIKKFTEYYLPTTAKLLRSYSMLEKQGISGKNIISAKQDIERILDSLTEGYERQLDKLFDADALDISSDIDVLETMLKQDGLSAQYFDSAKKDNNQTQLPSN